MALAKAKARTATRDESAARVPERDPTPARDNVIRTRDGRPVDLSRIVRQNDDYTNLTALGIIPPDGWA